MGRKDYGEQKSGYSFRGNNGFDKTLVAYMNEISKTYPLSSEGEVELGRRIKTGALEARNRLVEANLRFVVTVAKEFKGVADLGDLISVGNLGLITAANRFDEIKRVRFISYARFWIRQFMLQYLAEHGRTVRLPVNRLNMISKLKRFSNDYNNENEKGPSLEDIAKEFSCSATDASRLLTNNQRPLYFDAEYDENQRSLHETIFDSGQEQADEMIDRIALQNETKEALNSLDEREADVLRYCFGLDEYPEMSLEEIGGKYGVTKERIRQIKEKAIEKLRHSQMGKKLFEYCSGD